ncbi:pentatricopeptide repeat-containing protein At5g62370-like [Lycium barbarum]|uniref:pentatricopeptide repeat-containing protein At5g62370-like n=1 Tax=Lycium barbarum TaxID=112863 RepID=UPI00293F288F|nr:pentatricopeptide repeat-containing protein At5g62370-like [Lycium barbarum]
MTKHRLWLCFYFSRTKRRPFTAFPLRAKEATSSHVPINHKILCFSLAEKLIFRGLFDSAQKVIRRIIMQSSSLSEAITTLEFSISLGVEPMVHLLKTLALSLCKKGRVEEAQQLCMVMESYGFVLDKVMYTALINGHSKNRDMKMAMMVFLRMLKLGCEPDKYTYNTLINGFINLGMFDKVRVLHQQMVEFGLEPDGVSYQILICKYCKDHKVDRVLVLAEVDKMMDNGLVPDHVMFFTLINNNPRVLGISLAYKFLRAIAKNGCADLGYVNKDDKHLRFRFQYLQMYVGSLLNSESTFEFPYG